MRPTVQGGGSGSVQQGGPVEPRSRARRVRRGGAHRRGHPHPGDVLLWQILGKCASMTSPHPGVGGCWCACVSWGISEVRLSGHSR